MFKLDDNLLRDLGLGSLQPAEKNKMLAHIYETLELRVGMKLAEQMTNEQLDEFEAFIDKNDESGALKWLETNFPNYKQVVAEQLEALKAEIRQVAPQIVATSTATQSTGVSTQPQIQSQQNNNPPTTSQSNQAPIYPNKAAQSPQDFDNQQHGGQSPPPQTPSPNY